MMLRAREAIPKGAQIYVDAAGTLKVAGEAFKELGDSARDAIETLINPFSLGDPVDLADMEHRGAKRRTEIRLRGEQRRVWIEAEGRRRREEIVGAGARFQDWPEYGSDYSPEDFDAMVYMQPRTRGADRDDRRDRDSRCEPD